MKVQVQRAYNFNAGPSALPLSVLEKAQAELIDFPRYWNVCHGTQPSKPRL
jgi:phosphoserine aminotransferase